MEKEAYLEDLLADHESHFMGFVDEFLTGDPTRDTNIILKKDHSLRVYEEAKRLVAQLELDNPAPYLLAALYHDIGRFPQLAQFNTFLDKHSVNHGAMGARTLIRQRFLNDLPERFRRAVLCTVALHNRAVLPTGLPRLMRHMLAVVRDSDKLDIMQVLLPEFQTKSAKNEVALMGMKDEPCSYSDNCLKSLQLGENILYGDMRFQNDIVLLLLSWVFCLEFQESLHEFANRGYHDRLFDFLPDTPEIQHTRDSYTVWLKDKLQLL